MAKTMRIGLLLALVVVTGCRFVARQKTNVARLFASSLVSPFAELQEKAPLTQSSFRNDVVTPRQQNEGPVLKPASKPIAIPEPDPEPQPIVLAALHIPDNLPGVEARCAVVRTTRVRILNGQRCVIVIDSDAPHRRVDG